MAPALRIPVSLDMASLKQQADAAKSYVGDTLKVIGRTFSNANADILGVSAGTAEAAALAWGQSAARIALTFGATLAVGTLIFKGLEALIGAAREQLSEMIAIGDKAVDLRLSPETFQAFIKSAGTAKELMGSLEESLKYFSDAMKEKLNLSINPDELEQVKRKWSDVETTIRSLRELLPASSMAAHDFVAALNTGNVDGQLRAALQTLQEVFQQGLRLEGLDLAEKLFGAKFADNIRNGKIQTDQLVASFDRLKADGTVSGEIFSSRAVQAAKEVDDQLANAYRTLSQALRPALEGFATDLNNVKSLWVDIVTLIAKAASLLPSVPGGRNPVSGLLPTNAAEIMDEIDRLETELVKLSSFKLDPNNPLQASTLSGISARVADVKARIAELVAALDKLNGIGVTAGGGVPLPKARPLNIPDTAVSTGTTADTFDRAVANANRRIATLQADAAATNLDAAAQTQLRIELQLLEAASRDDNTITQAQIDTYARLRASMSEQQALTAAGIALNKEDAASFDAVSQRALAAAKALEAMKSPLSQYAITAQQSTKNLETVMTNSFDKIGSDMADVVTGAKTMADALRDIYKSLVNDLVKMFIKEGITGPLAGWLKGTMQGGGGNWLTQLLGGGLGGGAPLNLGNPGGTGGGLGGWYASGTDSAPGGLSVVGENGPELLNLPQGAQVIPLTQLYDGSLAVKSAAAPAGGKTVTVNAPITILAPDPASWAPAQAQVARTIVNSYAGAARFA